jgi:hypothetical protein
VTNIENLSKNIYNEIVQSFPKLVDDLEEHCTKKIKGINLPLKIQESKYALTA